MTDADQRLIYEDFGDTKDTRLKLAPHRATFQKIDTY
jgi:hypothetical protein